MSVLTKRFNEEYGYSLVEVMASIVILSIAILPMVGMFDMGLTSATRGSNYDIARTLAKKQLEQAQSLSYGTVRTSFPNAPCDWLSSGGQLLCEVEDLEVPAAEDPDGEFDHFRYAIRKEYVKPNLSGDGFVVAAVAEGDTGMMQITVEVGWGGDDFDDATYTATTLKVR
jgi:prepilin-type N-terminal cleavage/methylation domain-containing protein